MGGFFIRSTVRTPIYTPPTSAKLRDMGERMVAYIRNRTRAGLDEDNRLFAPYSPAYARVKGTARPDLTRSREMLDKLKVIRAGNKSVSIGWTSPTLRARARWQADGNSKQGRPPRPFFRLAPSRITIIRKEAGLFGKARRTR